MSESKQLIEDISATYDTLPYVSHAYQQTHPDFLRAVASLFGFQASPINQARILEIGCAFGGNILPLALYHPSAQITGIDLSAKQIATGQALIERLQLHNIRLLQQDISSYEPEAGGFDYIICHGVYSWVPPAVQAAIMRVIERGLSPNGLAIVSYNTYPGWKVKEIYRDVMNFRSQNQTDVLDKIRYGFGMLDFLQQHLPPQSIWQQALDLHYPQIRQASPSYLAHEYFELVNQPCYFHDFMQQAQAHGLAFLTEADFQASFVPPVSAATQTLLAQESGGDEIKLQQFYDFLTNRTFRQSLLCRQEQRARLPNHRDGIDHDILAALHIHGSFATIDTPKPTEAPNEADTQHRWRTLHNPNLLLRDKPLIEWLVQWLNQSGLNTVAVADLLAEAPIMFPDVADLKQQLLQLVYDLIVEQAVAIRSQAISITPPDWDKPQVSPAIRTWAEFILAHPDSLNLPGPWHDNHPLSDVGAQLIPLLDGSRTPGDLINALYERHGQGQIRFFSDAGQAIIEPDAVRHCCEYHTLYLLQQLHQNGLLSPLPAAD